MGHIYPNRTELATSSSDHFRSIVNQAEPAQLLDILDSPPTYIEIFDQLSTLKTGKAHGKDNIPAKFIECGLESLSVNPVAVLSRRFGAKNAYQKIG